MPGSVLFNAGYNKQVFSPKSRKKFGTDPSCCFREKRKKCTLWFQKM